MTGVNGHTDLIDADLGRLSLQPAFVEGIARDGRRFTTLESAYRYVFRRNLEWGILLWSEVPVRISYREDLPVMVQTLIELVAFVAASEGGRADFTFQTPTMETRWQVELAGEMIGIEGDWHRVQGDYQDALNETDSIWMARKEFLCEWKLLFEQLIQAMADSGSTLTRRQAWRQFDELREVEAAIPERGRFYRYDETGG